MKDTMNWTQVVTDEKTGRRVLVFTAMTNGLQVNPADLGDSDALLEINDD